MNYFERLNYAFSYAQIKNLPTSTRITYLTLIHKWNAFKQSASFSLSDRELQNLTGLSSNSITAAKRQLKNLKLIDFKAQKRGTIYFFPKDNAHFNTSCNAQPDAKTANQASLTTPSTNNNINKLNQIRARRGEILEF